MSHAQADPRRAERWSKVLVIALIAIFLFGMAGFALAVIDAGADPDGGGPAPPSLPAIPERGGLAPASRPHAVEAAMPLRLALADVSASPTASPSLGPGEVTTGELSAGALDADAVEADTLELDPATLAVGTPSRMPIVPVVRFWSKREGLTQREVVSALRRGSADDFRKVILQDEIADALAAELGIEIHADVRRGDPSAIAAAVRKGALGIMAAADVTPAMRLLRLDGASLTGNDRIQSVADWPLSIEHDPELGEGWDQGRTWVLVAGGDSFTDRGVYDTVVRKGKGVDHPFDGGSARVTGFGCCDPVFNDNIVPRYVLTGDKGIVRSLFKRAELAIANHEQPVTEAADFHRSGTRFSGQPSLTRIFSRAGIDYLSLANNHIGDYGPDGIMDTRRILRQHGIAFGGAGRDLDQARQIRYLDAGGTEVAIISCLDIVKAYWAGDGKSGATPCLDRYVVPDIKQAGRRADVVIVFPHWGVEYTRQPLPSMRKHAARWVKAGADLVLGAHSHVAGAIEDIDGVPVLYSLGNLIFDQHWSTNTMMSALAEVTFHGGTPIELRLRPYIIHDTSQPNLLDPESGEGRRLLKEVKAASADWLDW